MTDQTTHRDESIHEAFAADVRACGGAKTVGSRFWPDMDPEAAGKKLSRCINPHSDERLNERQVLLLIRMAREKGSYATLNFICDDTGFSRPNPVDPADERAELQRQAIEAAAQFKGLVERLEKAVAAK